MSRILVVVAHEDDEVLGCGGLIAASVDAGHRVGAICFTDGVGSRGNDPAAAARRRRASDESAAILGFEWLERGCFPDNGLDGCPVLEVVKAVEVVKSAFDPEIVVTHHGSDLNVDHQVVHRAVMTAFRPLPGESCRMVMCFETASSTEWSSTAIGPVFVPDLFVDIESSWQRKLSALNAYGLEMRLPPHPRSYAAVENLARHRGSQVGIGMAEAFMVVRQVIRDATEL